jgi:peroxiredoxin
MKKFWIAAIALTMIISISLPASDAEIDAKAPEFSLPDSYGNKVALSDYEGKWVVLEWINFDCPFVKKHYNSKNMQNLQKEYAKKGIVWLSICSSAPGKQGNFTEDVINDRITSNKAGMTAYLVDTKGKVGQMYGAKTTPHMFIINPKGVLVYAGGIDDTATPNEADVEKAKNYVREVLDALIAGKEAPIKTTKPYGCSVKY